MPIVDKERTGAVVLARSVNGLGMVRSLGEENIPVYFIQSPACEFISKSRFVTEHTVLKNLEKDTLLNSLMSVPEKYKVLIAGSDYFIDLLVENSELLSQRFRFITPSREITKFLNDKHDEVIEIEKIGIPLPVSYINLEKLNLKTEHFPIIIKPRTFEYFDELGSKNRILNKPEELTDFQAEFAGKLEHYIAQEVIQGNDENLWVCNCTFDSHHKLIQAFVFNRIRTHPAHYGVTSFARSSYSTDIINIVEKLGSSLGYVGPAMIEFKLDDKDGKYKYIEINPRIGMCNYFDTQCGINNVYLTYCVALGLSQDKQTPRQKDDIYFINSYEDFKSRLKDGEPVSNILKSYLSVVFKKRVGAYWSWNDIKPGILIIKKNLKDILLLIKKRIFGIT